MCYTVLTMHSLRPKRISWFEVFAYAAWGLAWLLIYSHLSVPGVTWEQKLATAFVSALLALFAPMIVSMCLIQLVTYLVVDLAIITAPFIWIAKLLRAIWNAGRSRRKTCALVGGADYSKASGEGKSS